MSTPSPTTSDWGDPQLAAAAAEFTEVLSTSWTQQVEELREIAFRLRQAADAYEEADQESVPRTGDLRD